MLLSRLAERTRNVHFACSRCPRTGRYRVASLFRRYGDVDTVEIMRLISADCPRWQSPPMQPNPCGIGSPTVSALWVLDHGHEGREPARRRR